MLRREPSRSSFLCHGLPRVSSRNASPLRRRGHAASPENLPALATASSRSARRVIGATHIARRPVARPLATHRSAPRPAPSGQSGRPPRSSGSPTRVSRPREGSDFPPRGAARHTARGHGDGSIADRAPGGRVALYGLRPRKRVAPSTALADPSHVPGGAP
jgi:hypothetical protein